MHISSGHLLGGQGPANTLKILPIGKYFVTNPDTPTTLTDCVSVCRRIHYSIDAPLAGVDME